MHTNEDELLMSQAINIVICFKVLNSNKLTGFLCLGLVNENFSATKLFFLVVLWHLHDL